MKNWNSFEQHMHDWKPRPPDERIKARLFRSRRIRFPSVGNSLKLFRWLTPATTVILFGIFFAGTSLPTASVRSSSITEFREPPLFGIQQLQTVIDSSFFQRNSLPTPTLASTNGGRMISSVGSFSLFVTNTLNH
jgi:hypothetical protein